jgi:tRNA-specific 2-thiouridylase
MTKDEVRKIAGEFGLPAAESEESQDVCFIPDGDYQTYLEQTPGFRVAKGPIVDISGRTIGEHDGIHTVTVGQRKGMAIAAAEPLYVSEIDAANNQVVAAPREAIFRDSINVKDIFWIAAAPPAEEFAAGVKVRYNSAEAPVTVKVTGVKSADIVFARPQFAPAPGQSAVIYDGAEVLGGGVIV